MCLSIFPLASADEMTDEDRQKKIDELDQAMAVTKRAMASIDALEKLVDAMSAQFFADCLRVITDSEFCTCIKENRPIAVNFRTYFNMTFQEYEYAERASEMSEEDNELFEGVLSARDQCSSI